MIQAVLHTKITNSWLGAKLKGLVSFDFTFLFFSVLSCFAWKEKKSFGLMMFIIHCSILTALAEIRIEIPKLNLNETEKEFILPIKISGATDSEIKSFRFGLSYDPEIFIVNGYSSENTILVGDFLLSVNPLMTGRVAVDCRGQQTLVLEDGVLVYLKCFRRKYYGKKTFSDIFFVQHGLVGESGFEFDKEVDFRLVSGRVTIGQKKPIKIQSPISTTTFGVVSFLILALGVLALRDKKD
ncbi:MAG: hypothetical protein DWQ06_04945 [Calditrichaeota bacterium]|nr:MAG: hypothetical protein DWQ06_04945 [Calditrichota bacterium]